MNGHDQRLGDFFTSRRERGEDGLPTLSVTLDRGLIPRDSLDRKTETNLTAHEHLRVRPGDIAYNMMRMWQGASGLASEEALVSPAYVVLAPRKNVDPLYASYLFKHPEMIHRFWAYSYGLTEDRLRLYFNDFKRIPCAIPPLPEQRKIAEILSTWDRAIETTEALLAAAKAQKRALMQTLLTGKRRLPEFEGQPWQKVRFGDIARIGTGLVDPKVDPYRSMLHVGPENVESDLGHISDLSTAESLGLISGKHRFDEDAIVYSKIRPNLNKVARPGFRGLCSADMYPIWADETACTPEFLLQLMRSTPFVTATTAVSMRTGMPKINRLDLASIAVSLPPLDEQIAIARVLSAADQEIDNLRAQISRLREEKPALMQQLLTGKRRVAV